MLHFRLILLFIATFLLSSCEEGGDCSTAYQNKFVLDQMNHNYLWYDELPSNVDFGSFSSPSQLLDFLRYDEKDRFSYITDASDFDNLFNAGQYMGYGFSYLTRNDDTVWVRFVYADSPSGEAGLERGDEILSINGESVADIIQANDWGGIFGPAEEGHPLDLVIRKADSGATTTLNLSKRIVNINTVLHHSVIDTGSEQIGYLVFKSFLNTSNAELAQVFAEFNAASVDKLILDLRYNGGGSVAVARNLGSYLNGATPAGEVFASLKFNDKNETSNSSYFFLSLVHDLDLAELTVIASGETCSASEMVINGLRPFMDVNIVGSGTCGKPVGMNKFEFCGKALLPVTFAAVNALGKGDYFDGLSAQCAATDDIAYAWGDEQEPMLATALYRTQNNQCPSSRPAARSDSGMADNFSAGSIRAIIGAI